MNETIINILFETEVDDKENLCKLIEECAIKTIKTENMNFSAQIDITIVDDNAIKDLNAEYRNKDSITDVLSFPMCDFVNGQALYDLGEDADPDTGVVLLGDMVLNYKRACVQALEYGHSAARECGFLTVHSCLHLLGYDHERTDDETKIMRNKEEAILSKLGLTRT